jgi:hypothetical protein
LSKFRRYAFIAVALVAVLFILRAAISNDFFTGVNNKVAGWVSAVLTVPERRLLTNLQDRFLRNNMALQPHQTDYVYEVTDSINSVKVFHQLYCVQGDKNPYLFGNNLMKFCSDIQSSKVLEFK